MECESSVQKRLFVAPSILLVRLLGQTSKKSKNEICPYRYTPFYTRTSRLNEKAAYKSAVPGSIKVSAHNGASLCSVQTKRCGSAQCLYTHTILYECAYKPRKRPSNASGREPALWRLPTRRNRDMAVHGCHYSLPSAVWRLWMVSKHG